jgi:hypothetical protein
MEHWNTGILGGTKKDLFCYMSKPTIPTLHDSIIPIYA